MLALDNLSHIPPWLSDCFCRLATGGGFGTRELYSDDEEKLFEAQRPVILNGIEELSTRADLLDRSIILYLPTIPEERRQTEEALWARFNARCPLLLGALMETLSRTLREYPAVQLTRLPRMADFARWATAAESALGWPSGDFLAAYTENREQANSLTLDNSPLVDPLLTLSAAGDWEGTATDLLQALTSSLGYLKPPRGWPSTPHGLSNAIRRLAPNLRAAGLEVSFRRAARKRIIRLERVAISASPASPVSSTPFTNGTTESDANDAGDAIIPEFSGSMPQLPLINDYPDPDIETENEPTGALSREGKKL